MKRLLLLPVLFVLLFAACKNKKPGILNSSNLAGSFITIDAGKDNTLKTPKGAIIKIAANSFDIPAGAKVNIEIKEAYSMQDILKAGLTTMSNGKLLQSGGMIYFNATAGSEPVNFLKPVGITIPSKVYDDSMKVFKGEIEGDSTINWIEPKPLDTSVVSKEMAVGKALFKANCASCHKPLVDMTGPAIAGSRDRAPNREWQYKFINNVNSMIETDPYARSMLAKWGSLMTQFNLPKPDIKAILDYCDNEAALKRVQKISETVMPETAPLNNSDSSAGSFNIDCGYDTVPVFDNSSISILPQDTSGAIDTSFADYTKPEDLPVYSFSIDRSGWYNIDCFIDNNINEVKDVMLTASLKNGDAENATVYLCIPSRKLLTYGREEKGNIIFYEEDGKIKLVPGDEAFILVVEVKKDKLYYGITKFTVQPAQHIVAEMKESTKEKILDAFRKNKLEDVKIDIDKIEVEEFIYVNETDSITNEVDTIAPKKEMQIIKNPCIADTTKKPLPLMAFANIKK